MILTGVQECDVAGDSGRYAWGRLALFQNVEAVAEKIMTLHGLPAKHRPNALKQSSAIRHCLLQAREYAKAASVATLATRPVLLYYSVMSLALAEIQFLQSAESRLDRLRAEHPCHGLQMPASVPSSDNAPLEQLLTSIKAKPQFGADGTAKGTFEVWRRSSRDTPVIGEWSQAVGLGQIVRSIRILMGPSDKAPASIPSAGISLQDCVLSLPGMAETMDSLGFHSDLVLATPSAVVSNNGIGEFSIIIHPQRAEAVDAAYRLINIRPSDAHRLDVTEFPGGVHLRMPIGDDEFLGNFPSGISIDGKKTWLLSVERGLNEFGLMYAAIHMAGNFCRYYPEKWLYHVERHTGLSLVIEKLTEVVEQRAPFLTLSQMTRSFHVHRVI